MIVDPIITKKLNEYKIISQDDEINALKEIFQEIALYALSNTDFFKKAAFHGGTSLRIIHGLPRFSEDLDFLLLKPDPDFKWKEYIDSIAETCNLYKVKVEITDKSSETNVKSMLLKENSIAKLINLKYDKN